MTTSEIKIQQQTKFIGLISWLYGFWAVLTMETYRMKRRNQKRCVELRKKFKDEDWVFGVGEHKGCSQVFTGTYGDMQPFSYLNDYNPNNYRLATEEEIRQAKNPHNGGGLTCSP